MTDLGLCHNATFPESCLSAVHIERLKPKWTRTITYWRGAEDLSSWEATIQSCRDLAAMGVKNLVVFNTEAYGGAVKDIAMLESRLRQFLGLADGSVHAIEPGNELDTPGWSDDGRPLGQGGAPISNELIVEIGARAAEVCHELGVLCLSPSLLTGPGEGRFEAIAKGLRGSRVHAMAVHPYGRSVGGAPEPGWLFGTIEGAADECRDLGSGFQTWFTEVGCWTKLGTRGFAGQRRFIEELKRFDHPSIDVVFYFTAFDTAVPEGEMRDGKDWGLIELNGDFKPSWFAFDGELRVRRPRRPPTPPPPPPTDAVFVAGFQKLHAVNPVLVGQPLANERQLVPGWSAQLTTTGRVVWSDLNGGPVFALLHEDGRRLLWREDHGEAGLREAPSSLASPAPRFVLGFETMHSLDPALIGEPLEDEVQLLPGWNAQRTSNGQLIWCDLKSGPKLAFFHADGRCFIWSEVENWPGLRTV